MLVIGSSKIDCMPYSSDIGPFISGSKAALGFAISHYIYTNYGIYLPIHVLNLTMRRSTLKLEHGYIIASHEKSWMQLRIQVMTFVI